MMVMVAAAVGIIAFLAVVVMVVMIVVMLVLIVVMMAAVLMVVVVVIVIIIMVMVMAAIVMIVLILVMVVMVVLMLVLRLIRLVLGAHMRQQLVRQRDLFDGAEDGHAVQLVPGCGENGGIGILLPQQRHGGLQLLLAQPLGAGENDGAGGLDLVVVELAEVLHVYLDLCGVRYGHKAVQLHVRYVLHGVLHRHDHVTELAHATGLDEDAVRVELLMYVLQRLVEVAHQRAADAPGGHFTDLHAGVLQEPTVNADLAELVFDQYQLLAGEGLGQQFLDKGRLTCAQESGNDVDLCHSKNLLFSAARCGVNFVPCSASAVQRTKKRGGDVFHLYNIPFFEKCKSCR